jgi:hypothetical protein
MCHPIRLATIALALWPFGPPRVEVHHHDLPSGVLARIETHVHVELDEADVRARVVSMRDGALRTTPVTLQVIEAGHRYELRRAGPAGDAHLVVVTVEQGPKGEHGAAEAVIAIDARGTIRDVTYPMGRWYDIRNAPRRATERELARALEGVRGEG